MARDERHFIGAHGILSAKSLPIMINKMTENNVLYFVGGDFERYDSPAEFTSADQSSDFSILLVNLKMLKSLK